LGRVPVAAQRGEGRDDETSSLDSSSSEALEKRLYRRIAGLNDDSTDTGTMAGEARNADVVTAPFPGKRMRSTTTAEPLRSDMKEAMVSETAADLDAKINRELDVIERIASSSKNLDMGIAEVRPKWAVTGALTLEIDGQESDCKASFRAERMAGVLRGSPVRVSVPQNTSELRLTRLDISIGYNGRWFMLDCVVISTVVLFLLDCIISLHILFFSFIFMV
jgi:hypothetical protein